MVEKLEAFTRKFELFDLDLSSGRLSTLKKRQAEGPGRSIVTEMMDDFIKQLRDNFSTRFEDYSMPKDIIAFSRENSGRERGELTPLPSCVC
ncbi:hypothetical protein J4Q44_G00269360 [Coregonus suidteri]|uniref:Uncharacterized protein n=1 Tax=Coregonus suidteri TaxID=861788 RepID=A0AAN8LKE2_9TELE